MFSFDIKCFRMFKTNLSINISVFLFSVLAETIKNQQLLFSYIIARKWMVKSIQKKFFNFITRRKCSSFHIISNDENIYFNVYLCSKDNLVKEGQWFVKCSFSFIKNLWVYFSKMTEKIKGLMYSNVALSIPNYVNSSWRYS